MSDNKYIKDYLKQGIVVYSFEEKGKCPNCNTELVENEFHNWICEYCWEQSMYNHHEYIEQLYEKWLK